MNVSKPVDTPEISQTEILAFVKKIAVKELELPAAQIAQMCLETPILEGLMLDSLTQAVLITHIEEQYHFLFEPEDGEHLETIKDLVEIIQQRAAMRRSSCD